MRLGEAMGGVLQSCTASQKPISSVEIVTQGKATAQSPLPALRSLFFCEVFAPPSGSFAKLALKSPASYTVLFSEFASRLETRCIM